MAVSETVTATGYTSSGVDETVTVTGWTSAGNTSGGGYDPNYGKTSTSGKDLPAFCLNPKMRLDLPKLKAWEGFILHAYVPLDQDGNISEDSSITLGMGVELHNLSRSQIMSFSDVDSGVLTKIADYAETLQAYEKSIGHKLTGTAAQNYIDNGHPLTFSKTDDSTDIENFSVDVMKTYYDKCASWYNKISEIGSTFQSLPEFAQTAIFSTYYNAGETGVNNFSEFLKQVKYGLWQDLCSNYMTWKVKVKDDETGEVTYETVSRRVKEGKELQRDIVNGNLAKNGNPCAG